MEDYQWEGRGGEWAKRKKLFSKINNFHQLIHVTLTTLFNLSGFTEDKWQSIPKFEENIMRENYTIEKTLSINICFSYS